MHVQAELNGRSPEHTPALPGQLRSLAVPNSPFIACLSTKRPEYDHDLFVAFKAFYTALLTSLDGDAARAALAGTGLADHFYFGDALYWFKLAYSPALAEA
jgi:hypothetical protein